ncbi:MAG TPA: SDR family NAD(P)-dependent oxidoreductase [Actinomycetota bacterium]
MALFAFRTKERTVLRGLIDDVLETSVVGSFTKLGYEARRRMLDWDDLDGFRMDGKVVVVTGANSGLGLLTATRLASMGASIRIVVRNPERGERARADIAAAGDGDVAVYIADLSSMASVRSVAAQIREREPRLDVLVHNAGGLFAERKESVEGHELTFATMVLGPFLLTHELVPLLEATPGARVLWVASGGMYTQPLDVDALEMGPNDYRGSTAYARAKRAQVVLSEEWAKRLRDAGVAVHAMHPGWADTPGLEVGLPAFRTLIGPLLRTPDEGADTIVWLAAAAEPGRTTGKFWLDRAPRSTEKLVRAHATPAERAKLWALCERLTADPTTPD